MSKFLTASVVSLLLATGSAFAQDGTGGPIMGGATGTGGIPGSNAATAPETDISVTGSISGGTDVDSSFMNRLGPDASAFFDSNGLRPEAEVSRGFAALSQERQREIQSQCTDLAANATQSVTNFCTAIGQ